MSVQVEVRFTDLDRVGFDDAWAVLSESERARADRFSHSDVRHRFVARRAFRRSVLAELLGIEAAEIHFREGPRGRPEVDGIVFNASSSAGQAVIATSESGPLGVDLERVDREHGDAVVRRALTGEERAQMLASDDQHVYFLRTWTRKEAVAKAIGSGLGVTPRSFEGFAVMESVVPDPRPDVAGEWWLTDLDAPDGFIAALATPVAASVRRD